jgi:predicted transcriptional regulator
MSLIRRIRPEKTGVRAPLGDLEAEVMRHVWSCGPEGCLGAQLQQVLERDRPTALTTVLTTLERLRDKGILQREREGKAYRYWAALSEEQLQQRIVEGVLGDLIAQFPKAVATYFAQQQGVETVPETAPETLAPLAERLELLSREKQQAAQEEHGDDRDA